MPTVKDQAIGSWEAAAVMGVHFTQPAVMVRKGLLTSRAIKAVSGSGEARSFQVYSLRECDQDYADYEETRRERKTGRPRSYVDFRPDELRRLEAVKTPIDFHDAIGSAEAAEIMGCHWTWPPRAARRGEIVGRIVHNGRDDKAADRVWIFSRASCEQNAAKARKETAAGQKIGRPRRGIKKPTLAT